MLCLWIAERISLRDERRPFRTGRGHREPLVRQTSPERRQKPAAMPNEGRYQVSAPTT